MATALARAEQDQGRAYLRQARWSLCAALMRHETGQVAADADVAAVAEVILGSDLYWEGRTPAESGLLVAARKLAAKRQGAARFRGAGMAAACLAGDVLETGWPGSLADAPPELRAAWWKFLFRPPASYDRAGEAQRYPKLLGRALDELLLALDDKARPDRQAAADAFLATGAFIQAYFTPDTLLPLYAKRARALERILELRGVGVHEARFADAREDRLRVGFLVPSLHSATETTFLRAHLKTIDRAAIAPMLYTLTPPLTPAAQDCIKLFERSALVPEALDTAIRLLRRERLDVLVIAGNVTANQGLLAQLAACRLAPMQVATMASPVTTGMRSVDAFLTGLWNEPARAQLHYSEHLAPVGDLLNCYPFPAETPAPRTRAELGLAEDATVFFSGANHFKVTAELSDAWAEILARVPGSVLVAMPFNPNWSSDYPRRRFEARVKGQLAARGVTADRLRLVDAVPTRAELLGIVALADVYLDAYPFSGACSALDPLVLGVPLAAWCGEATRSRHAYAMLRSAGLEECTATDRDGYVALAARLGSEPGERAGIRAKLAAAAEAGFAFLDEDAYGPQVSTALVKLDAQARAAREAAAARDEVGAIAAAGAAVRAHVAAGGAALRLTDTELLCQLVIPYFRGLGSQRRFLDVGAAMGGMALPLLYEGWQGTLFEPDPRCRAHLVAALGRFAGAGVLETVAVGERSQEQVTFHVADSIGLSGFGECPYAGSIKVSVPCVSLADYCAAHPGAVDFLKIDAEGFDFAVLRGFDFAQAQPALVMVEFGTQYEGTGEAATNAAIEWMEGQGYRAAAFACTDDGRFAHQDWTCRLIDVGARVSCPPAGTTVGNVLFCRAGDRRFGAGLADLIAQLLARSA